MLTVPPNIARPAPPTEKQITQAATTTPTCSTATACPTARPTSSSTATPASQPAPKTPSKTAGSASYAARTSPSTIPIRRKCQACPFVKPLFDRNTMKCEACPKGMEYDYDDKECVRSIDETIMVRDGEMSYN
jgi:hypothetical protein